MKLKVYNVESHVIVEAEFEPRSGLERRLRFYPLDACNEALKYCLENSVDKKFVPPDDYLVTDDQVVISNYREPFSGVWTFKTNIKFDDDKWIKMADEHLKENENSKLDLKDGSGPATLSKRARKKKDETSE